MGYSSAVSSGVWGAVAAAAVEQIERGMPYVHGAIIRLRVTELTRGKASELSTNERDSALIRTSIDSASANTAPLTTWKTNKARFDRTSSPRAVPQETRSHWERAFLACAVPPHRARALHGPKTADLSVFLAGGDVPTETATKGTRDREREEQPLGLGCRHAYLHDVAKSYVEEDVKENEEEETLT